MLLSKNSFFKQEESVLKIKREVVKDYLEIKEVDPTKYLIAYDYFCIHQKDFDGATIVKDLLDIPELDLNAMLHDYRYITDFGVIKKFKWDWEYFEGMNKLGKGYRAGRYIALLISSIFFIPYKLIIQKQTK
jgi:hypothetical protein